MELKIASKNVRQIVICIFFILVLVLNWLSICIDSLMPRLISYVIVGMTMVLHFGYKGKLQIKRKYGMKFGLVSLGFLVASIWGLPWGNKYLLDTDGIYQIVQPFLFCMFGYIFINEVNYSIRKKIYYFCLIVLLYTVAYCFFSGNITYDNRYYSAFSNAIVCAFYFMICFFLVLFYVKNVYLKLILLIVIAYAIVLTKTRSAWIALILSVAFYLLGRKNADLKTSRLVRNCLLIVSGILVVVFNLNTIVEYLEVVETTVSSRFTGIKEHGSTTQRIGTIVYVFKNTSPLWLLLGHGVGGMKSLLEEITITIKGFTSSDNTYLTLIYDYGIWGMMSIVKLGQVLLNSLKHIYEYDEEVKLFSCILVAIAIGSFFFEVLGWASISTATLIMIGMLYGLIIQKRY